MLEVLEISKNLFLVGGFMIVMISCGDNNYFQKV
jgi:hypothetical protein